MIQDKKQELLRRHAAGALSDEEREELSRMCGRDEIFAAADLKVAAIRRRRHAGALAMAAAAVAAIGAVAVMAPQRGGETLVAEQQQPLPIAVETAVADVAPAASTAAEQQPRAAVAASKPAHKVRHKAEEPVVMCNNECEADSVINDIWKFLSA